MSLKSKIKVVLKAYANIENKKQIPASVWRALKKDGFCGLRMKVGEISKKESVSSTNKDLYEEQQKGYTSNINEITMDIAIVINVEHMGTDILLTLDSLKHQTYSRYKLYLMAPKGYRMTEKAVFFYFNQNADEMIHDVIEAIQEPYTIFINGGNILSPDALEEFGCSVGSDLHDLVYCDECIFDAHTLKRTCYLVKPDFNRVNLFYDTFLGQGVFFRTDYLKKGEKIKPQNRKFSELMNELVAGCLTESTGVFHVEKVLLCRNSDLERGGRVYDVKCIKKIVENYGYRASVTPSDTHYHVKFLCDCLKISIIIPTDDFSMIERCVNNLLTVTSYPVFEIIIVSTEKLCGELKEIFAPYDNLVYVNYEDTYNYSKKCNLGRTYASGDILVFLHDYVRLEAGNWLEELVNPFAVKSVGAVSPKVLRSDETIRYAGIISGGFGFFPIPFNGEKDRLVSGFTDSVFKTHATSILSATCLAVRKGLFDEIGGFNETETPDKFSNAVLSLEISRRNYSCLFNPETVIHAVGGNWYDSWFERESKTAYAFMLEYYMEELSHDPCFTESMKFIGLKNLPLDNRFYGSSLEKGKEVKKKILMITHELSMTGAPIALMNAAIILKEDGNLPVFLSPYEGPLKDEIVKYGIPVLVDGGINGNDWWLKMAAAFDLVMVSTLSEYKVIPLLERMGTPTIWWVHESKASYELGADKVLPQKIGDNIHVYCGGAYAQKMLKRFRPSYHSDILMYGIEDILKQKTSIEGYRLPDIEGKMVFLSIGTHETRKGQDILAEAIRSLPETFLKQSRFFFLGRMVERKIHEAVLKLKEDMPNVVEIIDEVSRMELMSVYQQCHCVICSSRDDPMPVFMTEAMMLSKVCLCSENTGTASFIEDGKNGYIYTKDNPVELRNKIMQVMENQPQLCGIGENGRTVYENHFTMEIFADKLLEVVSTVLDTRE